MSDSDSQAFSKYEKFRAYLGFLGKTRIDRQMQGKIDLSGVVQQTLLEAHQQSNQIDDQPSEQRLAWLRKVMANNLADEIRKLNADKRDLRREQSLHVDLEQSSMFLEGFLMANAPSPSAQLDKCERAVTLASALEKLPPPQREAIVYQYWHNWTLAEIAEHMNRSPASVAGLLRRGISQLRDEISNESQS